MAAASALALQSLTVRVVANEMGVSANAAEITALEASVGGRALGPQPNMFTAATKEAAAGLRDEYAAANPGWLADYDADNDINIELRWGVLYIYQRRFQGEWVDNGEALARAAAVTNLNASVMQQGGEIEAQASEITQLVIDVADRATVTAVQLLTVRVGRNEQDLAQWTVKLQIGDLIGGIGLYNDGDETKLLIQADKLAIISSQANPNIRTPFLIDAQGRVIINTAVIPNASITNLMAENGFLTNMRAVHGFLAFRQYPEGQHLRSDGRQRHPDLRTTCRTPWGGPYTGTAWRNLRRPRYAAASPRIKSRPA